MQSSLPHCTPPMQVVLPSCSIPAWQQPSPGHRTLPPRLDQSPLTFGYSLAGLMGCEIQDVALPNGIDMASVPVGKQDPGLQHTQHHPAPCAPGAGNSQKHSEHLQKAQCFEPELAQNPKDSTFLSHPFPHFQFKLFCAPLDAGYFPGCL